MYNLSLETEVGNLNVFYPVSSYCKFSLDIINKVSVV